MSDNVQQLPPGLAGRVNSAVSAPASAQAPAVAPATVVQPSPVDAGAVAPVEAPVNLGLPALPANPPVNPMLSRVSQPQPEAPAAVVPPVANPALVPPKVPTVPGAEPVPKNVAELAGAFAADAALAPAVAYLDAVFEAKGLDLVRVLGQAAEELDARFIDRAYLVEKLGQAEADTLIKVASDSIAYVAAYNTESLKQVFATAGTEQQFRAAAQAFNEKADPTEKAMIMDLLDSGVRDKMNYAARKIAEFGVQAGVVVRHHAQPLGQPGSQQGLSKEDYAKAISERNLSPEKYEQLKNLRKLGMSQGR